VNKCCTVFSITGTAAWLAGAVTKGAARMSSRTESYLVGLVGDGVTPSLTPPMHEREGDVQGLRYLYRPIDLLELGLPGEAVGELLQSARTLGFNGLNITHASSWSCSTWMKSPRTPAGWAP
jgi:hypothetical protein